MAKKLIIARHELTETQRRGQAARWKHRNRSKLPNERIRGGTVRTPDGRRVDRVVSLDAFESGEGHDVVLEERGHFLPMQGMVREVNLSSADLSARVRRALGQLSDERRELLEGYYFEGLEWHELLRGEETKQSWFERLEWAKLAFVKAWNETAELPLELREEDL